MRHTCSSASRETVRAGLVKVGFWRGLGRLLPPQEQFLRSGERGAAALARAERRLRGAQPLALPASTESCRAERRLRGAQPLALPASTESCRAERRLRGAQPLA